MLFQQKLACRGRLEYDCGNQQPTDSGIRCILFSPLVVARIATIDCPAYMYKNCTCKTIISQVNISSNITFHLRLVLFCFIQTTITLYFCKNNPSAPCFALFVFAIIWNFCFAVLLCLILYLLHLLQIHQHVDGKLHYNLN